MRDKKKAITPADLEELFLGARQRHTRFEVAEAAGMSPVVARRHWRALGFANVADDAKVLTDADVRALRELKSLLKDGLITEDEAVRVTRALGQTTARLAEWFAEEFIDRLRTNEEALGDDPMRAAYDAVKAGLPTMEDLLLYAWRRHLAAVVTRVNEAVAGDGETPHQMLAVGFADLVSFTRLSRRLELADLADLVDSFETIASDIVAAYHGRLVKTLGDEVLFVAEDPVAATEIALQLVEQLGAHPEIPDIRVGVAYGEVLGRLGDVFGTTVNLASRLTSIAAPGTIVIDRALRGQIEENPAYRVSALRRRPVRGLGLVDASRLRRSR
jgi:adenylate cyclase